MRNRCSAGVEKRKIMYDIAAEHGYIMGGASIPMSEELLNSADLIIVMTEKHREEVKTMLQFNNGRK